MLDVLGNELRVKDFIAVDSSTAGGKRLGLGIVVAVDEEKKKLHYVVAMGYASGTTYFYKKFTTLLERIMKIEANMIPHDKAAEIWKEAQKYV